MAYAVNVMVVDKNGKGLSRYKVKTDINDETVQNFVSPDR